MIFRGISFIFPTIIIIYCYHNTSVINDDFLILKEMRYIILSILSYIVGVIIILIVYFIILGVFFKNIQKHSLTPTLVLTFHYLCVIFATTLATYFLCRWPRKVLFNLLNTRRRRQNETRTDNKTTHLLMHPHVQSQPVGHPRHTSRTVAITISNTNIDNGHKTKQPHARNDRTDQAPAQNKITSLTALTTLSVNVVTDCDDKNKNSVNEMRNVSISNNSNFKFGRKIQKKSSKIRNGSMFKFMRAGSHDISSVDGTRDGAERKQIPVNATSSTDSGESIDIFDILSNEICFDLMFQHLSDEFSMECLLSLTEFTHYTKFVIDCFKIDIDRLKQNGQLSQDFMIVKLPNNVPPSGIVIECMNDERFSGKNELQCKMIAFKLYEKYIKIGAPYEINIYDETRMMLTSLMTSGYSDTWMENESTMSGLQLLTIFDGCCHEMIKLLTISFARLTTKENLFDKMCVVLGGNERHKGD